VSGIYAIADLKALGQQKGWCPYFTSRRLVSLANVVVYNYQYMLDPKIASMVSRDIAKESIIVRPRARSRAKCTSRAVRRKTTG
jgi:DNA excision repair protein ERCC-2